MVKQVTRKSKLIRYSGRSTNYLTPSFGFGCLYNCTYCYMKRHLPKGLNIATNTEELLEAVDNHVNRLPWPKEKDQTHPKYWTYDLSCNEDFVLHMKYHDWETIFDFFKDHPKAFASMATKYVNPLLLTYNPNRKIRVRMSLMPQEFSTLLEPNTSLIIDRINFINDLVDTGYDVDINFSPVIVSKGALVKYKELFYLVDSIVKDKEHVNCEVIFLTHNEEKHKYNLDNNLTGEGLLWNPEIQQSKVSQYGGKNIRYKLNYKQSFIKAFKQTHQEMIPWCDIRYIF